MLFQPAQRLQALPTYLFVEIARRKQAAIAAGKDVIDFGVGATDLPTPDFIIDRMKKALDNPVNHRYAFDEPSSAIRESFAAFFERRYGQTLDPQREIRQLIGSKEGVGHLPLAVVNPGQVVLTPEPGYPVYRSAALLAGGEPHVLELSEVTDWLPDLESIPDDVARRASLMFINYPNNPTGATASLDFFAEVIDFAKRYDIIVAQDAAYNDLYFDAPPPSIMEVPGAIDVAVEFHSSSKTFNMTGWRAGFVVGNPGVISALARVKSMMDSGMFAAVQEATMEAYGGIERAEIDELRGEYRERLELMTHGLRKLGFTATPPRATFYIWAGVPAGLDSMTVAARLLEEAGVVCTPGVGFGEAGEGYVRFTMSVGAERISEALSRIRGVQWTQ